MVIFAIIAPTIVKTTTYILHKYFVLACFILVMVSCGNQKQATSAHEQSLELIDTNPQIAFFNYRIKAENDVTKVNFLNKTISEGKLKTQSNEELASEGDLICSQLDDNSNVIASLVVKNPLKKNHEFIDNTNTLQKQQHILDSTNFSVRFQLLPNAKYIRLSNYNNSTALLKTPI